MQDSKEMLIATLKNLPEIIQNYMIKIPAEQLDIKRNSNTWTIREHFYHLVGLQPMLYERLKLMKAEKNSAIKPYTPTKEAEEKNHFSDLHQAFIRFHEVRTQQIELIESMTSEELNHKATHPEYKDYGVLLLLNHMIFHEYWHMYRLEEIWLTKDEFFE